MLEELPSRLTLMIEIQNLGMSALGDRCCEFDVAVDDAFGMGCVEGVGNLDGQRPESLSVSSSAPADAVRAASGRQKLHGGKVCIDADPENQSWLVQMFGWFSAEAALASCSEAAECLQVFG